MLESVLIKVTRGGRTDRILGIENVPSEMFYEIKHPRKCVGEGQAQHWVDDTDKPMQPTLYPELTLSQTGDKAIMFNLDNEQSLQRYLALDRYIRSVYPSNKVIPQPVVNSVDPKNTATGPLASSDVPKVVLPALSPSADEAVAGSATRTLDVDAIKKAAIEEHEAAKKVEASERMAKARAARTTTHKA